jgi:hypothetical protein
MHNKIWHDVLDWVQADTDSHQGAPLYAHSVSIKCGERRD